jgi:hypothetical protein
MNGMDQERDAAGLMHLKMGISIFGNISFDNCKIQYKMRHGNCKRSIAMAFIFGSKLFFQQIFFNASRNFVRSRVGEVGN